MSRRPKANSQPGGPPPLDRLEAWLRAISLVGVVAGLLAPIVYAQVTWFAFTALKVFWLQAAVGLCLPAYVVLAMRRPEFRPPRTWVFLAMAVHFGAISLSTVLADDRAKAWWGTLDRMDGLWSLIHFAAFSTLAAGMARTWRDWRWLLHIEVAVGLAAGCVAMLQVPFPMLLGQATDVRISGVFGNPIFSAAYHSLNLFLVALLWTKEKRPSRRFVVLYLASGAASIVAMVLAGSRGVLLGFACAAGTAILLHGFLGRARKAIVVGAIGLVCVAAFYLVFATLIAPRPELTGFWDRHQNLLHLFILHDDAGRLGFWRLTLTGLGDRPMLGFGPSNFDALFDRHYVPIERCGPQGADNAHNVVLQALATTGVLGLATFLFLWGAVVTAILRAHRRGDLERRPAAVLIGLPVAHLVQLLFNPESPATLLLCYLVFALAAWLERPQAVVLPAQRRKPGLGVFMLSDVGGVALVVAFTVLPAYASEMALLAVTDLRHNRPVQAFHHARQAASVPSPYLDDQLSVDLQLLLAQAEGGSLGLFPAWRDLFALDRRLADRYLAHHKTLRFRTAYARTLHAVGVATHDQALVSEGERRLREALQDHPKRQEVMFALAALLSDHGQLDESEQLYRRALDEEPRIGESHFRLGRFLWRHRDLPAQGANYIVQGTRGVCGYYGGTLSELSLIANAFADLGDKAALRALVPLAEQIKQTLSPHPYLEMAGYLEQAGMLAERDRILRLGMQHSPEVAGRARPILQGRARTLAETAAGP